MNSNFYKKFLELNLAILCISTAGALVRYIELSPIILMFWRGVIAAIVVGTVAYFQKASFKISSKKDKLRLFFSSFLFATHWLTYFYALQVSSVAIGMLSLFTFPAITAILEPFYFKTKFNKRHIILALLVLFGLFIMSPEIDFSSNSTKGILSGVLSAFLYALRNLTMKSNIKKYDSSILMFYQFLFLIIVSAPFLRFLDNSQTINFIPFLIVLGVFTTAIGHTLFVKSFKNFPVSTASIISTSQPVYGILFGLIFLNEIPNLNIIIGGCIIISTVVIESLSIRAKKG